MSELVNEIKQKTSPSIIPDINIFDVDGKTIVVISVHEYPVKPLAFQGRYYKRVANSNQQLSLSQIADLHLQSLQISWDSYKYPKATIQELSSEKIERLNSLKIIFKSNTNLMEALNVSNDGNILLRQ